MSSKLSDAKRIANFLRVLADRLESDPNFVEELMPPKTRKKPKAPNFDLLSAIHQNGVESTRHQLMAMDIGELKSLISKNSFDTTGKVRKWKQKTRIVDFLIEAVSRRADFGDSIFPGAPQESEKTA
jgi:hypothetical protein